ncbi:MAG: YraN family protein [Acutalibacteraceae bacterium]|jgi:putative endonuclease
MLKSTDIGKKGENLAISYIENKGYKIIIRNYHSKFGEIDIIAKKEKYIVFIEVKTRNTSTKLSAFEAVDKFKQKKIIKTAMIYLIENNVTLQPRFDVIAILFDKKICKIKEINHIENAFDGVDFFETF